MASVTPASTADVTVPASPEIIRPYGRTRPRMLVTIPWKVPNNIPTVSREHLEAAKADLTMPSVEKFERRC